MTSVCRLVGGIVISLQEKFHNCRFQSLGATSGAKYGGLIRNTAIGGGYYRRLRRASLIRSLASDGRLCSVAFPSSRAELCLPAASETSAICSPYLVHQIQVQRCSRLIILSRKDNFWSSDADRTWVIDSHGGSRRAKATLKNHLILVILLVFIARPERMYRSSYPVDFQAPAQLLPRSMQHDPKIRRTDTQFLTNFFSRKSVYLIKCKSGRKPER